MNVPFIGRGTRVAVFCTILTVFFALPAPVRAQTASFALKTTDAHRETKALSLAVPEDIGQVQERYRGNGIGTVVLIQDAHAVYEAQKSVEKTFLHLAKAYGFKRGGTEGGTGAVHPGLLQSYPDAEVLREVLSQYLREGELSGAVTAAVLLNGQFHLQALEDRPLYETAVRAYRQASSVRSKNLARLSRAIHEVDRLQARVFSPERLSMIRLDREFRSGRNRDLAGYLLALSRYLEAGDRFPLIRAIFSSLEPPLDASERACAGEINSLARRLTDAGLKKEDLSSLNQLIQSYRTSHTGLETAAVELIGLARSVGLALDDYPHLQQAAASGNALRLAMKGPAFLSELGIYADQVLASFATGHEERRLVAISQKLTLLERLSSLELTLEQWTLYRAMSAAGAFSGLVESLLEEGEPIDTQAAELFYKTAEDRDRVFFRRILRDRAAHGGGDYVFLAGGFHAGGMTALLRSEGIPYVLITPRITELPREVPYEKMMSADVSWREFFRSEHGEVDLEAAFLKGAVRRLIQRSAGDQREKVLRLWRDEALRRLAAAGQASDFGRYARYLDETPLGSAAQESLRTEAEELLNSLKKNISVHPRTSESAVKLSGKHAAMPFTNINAGRIGADLITGLQGSADSRSELRSGAEGLDSLGSFTGINDRMPIIDFMAAFGIDAAEAVPEPIPGMPDFARVPVALTQDTLESAATIFLTQNTYVQAPSYVTAVKENNLESLRDLYLLTYQGRPAAMIWARKVESLGQNGYRTAKTLIYPLLVYQQAALFSASSSKQSTPPFPDPKTGNTFYQNIITSFVRNVHGTSGQFHNLSVLDDPYIEDPTSAMHVRVWDDMESGFAFPGTYGPWERSTRFLLEMMDTHLLTKLDRDDLNGLNLVDVGSGAGRVAVYLAAQGADVQAYDLTLMKAMNTRAWARAKGLLSKVTSRKALSAAELDSADGYIVNFPNLDVSAQRLDQSTVMTYKDSRHLNISIHPEDFRKVMEDLRAQAKPGAFLFIRGNFKGAELQLFEQIMREVGWTEGLESPLTVPDGVEAFGAAYFLRQGQARSELRQTFDRDPSASILSKKSQKVPSPEEYALVYVREIGYSFIAALSEGRSVKELALKLGAVIDAAEGSREILWSAFETAYREALQQLLLDGSLPSLSAQEASAVRAMISNETLFPALERRYQNLTGMKAAAEVSEPSVAFALGEKLVYQASLRSEPDHPSAGVSGILLTALENQGRLIVAAQAGSPSSVLTSRALDEALGALGRQVRSDRIHRVLTGEVTPMRLLEDRLGRDGDVSRLVVFFENGDGQILCETDDQKRRGLVFVIQPEALSLLSVPEVMRILKKLASVPAEMREFYRDELGLRPDPESGVTVIGREFLDRLARIASAESQILTSA